MNDVNETLSFVSLSLSWFNILQTKPLQEQPKNLRDKDTLRFSQFKVKSNNIPFLILCYNS